ncbi:MULTISPECIES: hypothetical protein [unclassified Mesorhizobium]|uniref:hypothetical protein n=2 Tax=Mesorhizobium TaxID=68287 RepID=UPI0004CE8286|nr:MULTISPECIES: hypothetical protein [unclassified Mesorhizobium]WJI55466.1 hypothetical protein NLY33_19840 [Mesorhizobium sp. C432A]
MSAHHGAVEHLHQVRRRRERSEMIKERFEHHQQGSGGHERSINPNDAASVVEKYAIDPRVRVGHVHLNVADEPCRAYLSRRRCFI